MPPKANILSPAEYARLFQNGDEQGLRYFFDTYYPALCFYGQRLCDNEAFAAEIASEAFYQCWRQRVRLISEVAIRAYLFTLVKNGCIQYLKKKNQQTFKNSSLLLQPERTVQETMIYSETIRELHQAILRLPKQCSAVLQMLFIEGKSISETSRELNLSISTVKTHKRIGLKAIKRGWRQWM